MKFNVYNVNNISQTCNNPIILPRIKLLFLNALVFIKLWIHILENIVYYICLNCVLHLACTTVWNTDFTHRNSWRDGNTINSV